MAKFQPGDKVAVITEGYFSQQLLLEAINAAPVVVVIRSMPEHAHDREPDQRTGTNAAVEIECSDGQIHLESQLHLVAPADPAVYGKLVAWHTLAHTHGADPAEVARLQADALDAVKQAHPHPAA